jgi:hypothetical protein
MSGYSRGVIWFNRFVLAASAFVMTMIALRNLRDPIDRPRHGEAPMRRGGPRWT